MKTTSKSVHELVDKLADKPFAHEMQSLLARKQLVKQLVALRSAHGITQQAIADRLNCKQSRVSKLEAGEDSQLTLEEIKAYADSIGLELSLGLAPKSLELTDKIKLHAFAIKALLQQLVESAQGVDSKVAEAIAQFHAEAFLNLVTIIQDSAGKIPPSQTNEPYIRIEVHDQPSVSQSPITLIPDGPSHLYSLARHRAKRRVKAKV
jgi:transcriptional regulator with XRE-family HTH domain